MRTLANPELLIQPCQACQKAAAALETALAATAGHRSLSRLLPTSVECRICGGIGWTLTDAGRVLVSILSGYAASAARAAEKQEVPF